MPRSIFFKSLKFSFYFFELWQPQFEQNENGDSVATQSQLGVLVELRLPQLDSKKATRKKKEKIFSLSLVVTLWRAAARALSKAH